MHCNAQMTTALLHKYAEPDAEGPMVQDETSGKTCFDIGKAQPIDAEGMEKLREAITKMNMSACYTLIIERIITLFIN